MTSSESGPGAEAAPGYPEVLRIVAPNPGPMTGAGTNTYLYGADPCAVIDPGSEDEAHLGAIRAAAAGRGGIGAVIVTHDHPDHSEGAELLGAEVVRPVEGEEWLGLTAIATPGHAADHVCLLAPGGVCFSGDLVLGEGWTIVLSDGGGLGAYMGSLRRLRELDPALICPGHGPWITAPAARLAEYVEHRERRERDLLAALGRGERSRTRLVDEVWSDAPPALRPFAELSLATHLDKLAAEGRLPAGLVD